MKKTILFTFMALLTLLAHAQEAVITQEGRIPYIIPGEVTIDGKPRVCIRMVRRNDSVNDSVNVFYIYNQNMELETTIEVPKVQLTAKYTIESATVPGTSINSYDSSNAEWHIDIEEQGDILSSVKVFRNFYSLDSNTYMEDYREVMPTQTLFNNDENWELVLFADIPGLDDLIKGIVAESYDAASGTVLLKRYKIFGRNAILNQNGQQVGSIKDDNIYDIESVWISNGKKYISTRDQNKSTNYINKFILVNDSGTSNASIRGDINNDGTVSMPDAMFIVNKILNGKFPDE